MKFICTNAQFVELKVLGYQFPKISNNDDDDWLVIYINVKSNKLHWNATDSAITTFELQMLINWFKNISNNKIEKYKRMDFMEPNLSFELLNNFDSNIKEININFAYEFSPPKEWEKGYIVPFKATNEQLKIYAEELEQELAKYPER
jgi:hypothetical protein